VCFVYSPLVVPFVSWKSILVLALDACFKLKLKDRSFFDPDLGTRLAYMVDDDKYRLPSGKTLSSIKRTFTFVELKYWPVIQNTTFDCDRVKNS
jgi:hypothetical protein